MKNIVGYLLIATVVFSFIGLIFASYQYGVSKGIEQGEGCFGGSCALNELKNMEE